MPGSLSESCLLLIAWVAHHLTALPYSFSAHAHDIYEENSMLPAKLQKAEFVLTCTEFNRKHLSSLISECEQRIKRIYHGLELEKYREDAAYHKNENGVLRILSIGTLYKTKGFDVLVETCALLKKQRIPFQCKIVGDGPEWKKLQRLIVSLGLQDDVHMLGYLEHDVLRPLRHWANVFILLARPYLHWGLPNVYIEALASKLAVIATPLNAVPELIKHDETGLIVENDNPVATMQALLRMQQFPEDRQRMAEAGQHLAYQLFDAQKTSQQVIEVFREIVTSSVKRPSPAVTARSLRRSSPQSRAGDCFVEDS
ncbi:MAG: glycosyltransferase family 4 protein [bacterium]